MLFLLLSCSGGDDDSGAGEAVGSDQTCLVVTDDGAPIQCTEGDSATVGAACAPFEDNGTLQDAPCSTVGCIGVCTIPGDDRLYYYEEAAAQEPETMCTDVSGGIWQSDCG